MFLRVFLRGRSTTHHLPSLPPPPLLRRPLVVTAAAGLLVEGDLDDDHVGKDGKSTCHALALRLVVLTQLSSCSVERVFSSKLENIRICGENLFDDMTEIRLFLQCNGDMRELLDSLKKYHGGINLCVSSI